MKKNVLILSIFILISSFSFVNLSEKKHLKRILEYYFLSDEHLSVNSYDISYKKEKIDSIFFNTIKVDEKYTLFYKNKGTKTEVYKYKQKLDTTIKKYEYNFNSEKKLISFLTYSNTKLINKDSFIYDTTQNIIIKYTKQYYLWIDSTNYYKTLYQKNKAGNIYSSNKFHLFNKDSIVLLETKKYKYDNKINPFKNFLFLNIKNIYFNTNNVIAEYSKNLYTNTEDSIKFKYKYNKDGYIIKKASENFPNSKKSFAKKYLY